VEGLYLKVPLSLFLGALKTTFELIPVLSVSHEYLLASKEVLFLRRAPGSWAGLGWVDGG
jgi:hypothetical protein